MACSRRPSVTFTVPASTPARIPTTTFSPWLPAPLAAWELQLRFLPAAKRTKPGALLPERAFDAGGADLEVVAVRDDVRDVEGGAQVARDSGAELEIDGGVARVGVRVRAPELLHENARRIHPPCSLLNSRSTTSAPCARTTGSTTASTRARSMEFGLLRASSDMVDGGGPRTDKTKKAAPRSGVRASSHIPNRGGWA